MSSQNYNEVRKCRMCNKKFFVDREKSKQDYNHKFYCSYCYKRYFEDKEK